MIDPMRPVRLGRTGILRLIRDRQITDWASFCSVLHIPPDPQQWGTSGNPYEYSHMLEEWKTARLVTFADRKNIYAPIEGPIEVTTHLREVQSALRMSLTKVARASSSDVVLAAPLFGSPRSIDEAFDIFVLMPFADKLKAVYDDHIQRVSKSLKLSVGRADDLFTTHSVMQDVWDNINSASIILADCTGRNPNVFYELGIAHTLGKPVILTTQDADDVPFDIRHIRYILYEYTPRGMQEFEERLNQTLKGLLAYKSDAESWQRFLA